MENNFGDFQKTVALLNNIMYNREVLSKSQYICTKIKHNTKYGIAINIP